MSQMIGFIYWKFTSAFKFLVTVFLYDSKAIDFYLFVFLASIINLNGLVP